MSLNLLTKIAKHDINSVQKHKQMIIDCLKENDSSIKKFALDLLYLLINENNVEIITKELLN